MKKLSFFVFLMSASMLFAGAPSYDPYSYLLFPKNYQFKLSEQLFSTTGYFDHDGVKKPLPNKYGFSRLDSDFSIRKGFVKDFEGQVFLKYRQQSSDVTDAGGNVKSTSASGLESYGFMLRFGTRPIEKLKYTIEAGIKLPAFKNDTYETTSPYKALTLGDDVTELFLGAALSGKTKAQNFWNLRAHYNHPSTNLSKEIKYSGEWAYVWQSWSLIGGLSGIYSLETDNYSTDVNAKPKTYTGATHLYNSINRSYMAPHLGLNWAMTEHFRMETKYVSYMSGSSYDQGNEIVLNLVYSTSRTDDSEYSKKDEKFKTYSNEATIVKISPRARFARIDKGVIQDVEKGMKIDVYEFNYLGGNKLLATGYVHEVASEYSIIKLVTIFENAEIKSGHVVRIGQVD